MYARVLYLVLLSLGVSTSCYSNKIIDIFKKNKYHSESDFFQKFPFQEYLEENEFPKVVKLEQFRLHLDSLDWDYEQFILTLSKTFVQNVSVSPSNLEEIGKKVLYGKMLFNAGSYLTKNEAFIYIAAGDLILTKVSLKIEVAIERGKVSKKNPDIIHLVEKLEESKFVVDISMNKYEKLWYHTKKGNFDYIWEKAIGTYKKESLIFLFSLLTIIILIFFFIERSSNNVPECKALMIN